MAESRRKVVIAARRPPDLTTGGGATYAFYLLEGIRSLASCCGVPFDLRSYWGSPIPGPHRGAAVRTERRAGGLEDVLRVALWRSGFPYGLWKRLEWARYRRDIARIMADSIGAIHAHDPHVAYPLLGRFPVVYTHHARGSLASESDMSPIRPSRSVVSLWRQIDEDVFNKSAAVVFPSMGAYRLAVEEYPSLAARNVQIIYTGIPDVFGPRRESRAGQQRTVLTISAHVPDKKVPAALEAFHRYLLQGRRAQHTHFVSLGSYGPDTATLRSYSERWKLEGRVSLLGRVSRDQTVEWLRRAWVFIHMPDRAVFDLALLEALSAGIPVIASPVQGNVEMLGDDWPGYARSAEEAALLLGALADEGLWRDWSRRARARFEGCFTLEKMARSYLALYDEVIRGCR